MPATMIHMNDAELWGSLLDDPRMRQLAQVIDQNAEAASGYQADDHDRLAIRAAPSGLAAADMTPDQRGRCTRLSTPMSLARQRRAVANPGVA